MLVQHIIRGAHPNAVPGTHAALFGGSSAESLAETCAALLAENEQLLHIISPSVRESSNTNTLDCTSRTSTTSSASSTFHADGSQPRECSDASCDLAEMEHTLLLHRRRRMRIEAIFHDLSNSRGGGGGGRAADVADRLLRSLRGLDLVPIPILAAAGASSSSLEMHRNVSEELHRGISLAHALLTTLLDYRRQHGGIATPR